MGHILNVPSLRGGIITAADSYRATEWTVYRSHEAVQILHLEGPWVLVVDVLKLFQQGLMVQGVACR